MLKRANMPPLGVKPRWIIEEERIKELQDAIKRFLDTNWPIPDEIFKEYNALTERLDIEE